MYTLGNSLDEHLIESLVVVVGKFHISNGALEAATVFIARARLVGPGDGRLVEGALEGAHSAGHPPAFLLVPVERILLELASEGV